MCRNRSPYEGRLAFTKPTFLNMGSGVLDPIAAADVQLCGRQGLVICAPTLERAPGEALTYPRPPTRFTSSSMAVSLMQGPSPSCCGMAGGSVGAPWHSPSSQPLPRRGPSSSGEA